MLYIKTEDCGDKKRNLLKKHQSGFEGSPYYPPFEIVSTNVFSKMVHKIEQLPFD